MRVKTKCTALELNLAVSNEQAGLLKYTKLICVHALVVGMYKEIHYIPNKTFIFELVDEPFKYLTSDKYDKFFHFRILYLSIAWFRKVIFLSTCLVKHSWAVYIATSY